MDHAAERLIVEEFDFVIVATGHFSTPNAPEFPGVEAFRGRVLHAHDFRDAREFTGKRVLIIGSSYSAEDIGSQCHKYGAKSVTFSYRSAPMGYDWPETLNEVALLSKVDGNTAYFLDGTTQEIDAIVLCTGYLHHFPFLPDHLRLKTHNRLYPPNLYKGIFFTGNPRLMYLGMQDQYFTFNMFDAQAWYARDVIQGKILLPDSAAMDTDAQEWLHHEESLVTHEDEIDFQATYVRDLLKETDYPEFDVERQADLFKQWLRDKHEDILGYRNRQYVSTLTGTLSPRLSGHWMEQLDDSLEAFISGTQGQGLT